MLEDLFNRLLIIDETDDFHPSLTFGASQGVRLIDLLDQSGPVFQVVLGTESFIKKVRGILKGKVLSQEIVERGRLEEHPGIHVIVREVGRSFGVKERAIRERRNRGNMARQGSIYLAHRYTGLSNAEIGAFFGVIHSSGVSKASARVKEEMVRNQKLSTLIQDIESTFKA